MATGGGRAAVSSILVDLENVWGVIDELLGTLGPSGWSRKHGPDWVFADLPYHLAYFDRDIVVNGIQRGPDMPASEQRVWRNMEELNAWNARKFAERAGNQTPQQSIDQMHASREAFRGMLAEMADTDLERPVFIPITGCGWFHAGMALYICLGHTWSHATELRLRLERTAPVPSASATHSALGFYSGLLLMALDREQAAKTRLTTVMEFTGPGGGAWTVRVADGGCTLVEERAPHAEVVLTQSPETFVKTLVGMLDPMTAIQSGAIQVAGMEHLATYGALFPPLTPERVIQPMGRAAP
ncbi:MAG: DinB family protein [Chloroflexi bacterium]|nr:DinB family protein [Chloroflexota bacterium]